eukprot:TRINITY_DN16165_c0_g1_i1.p1 TRINITY_DN16165_c0_g1~~TRINITY_DN16165_c0_g1_i1.p1  ORF type:complete len:234 (-),score=20.57 TRINITY_DN16165_c0_g1_i1:39-680(-)
MEDHYDEINTCALVCRSWATVLQNSGRRHPGPLRKDECYFALFNVKTHSAEHALRTPKLRKEIILRSLSKKGKNRLLRGAHLIDVQCSLLPKIDKTWRPSRIPHDQDTHQMHSWMFGSSCILHFRFIYGGVGSPRGWQPAIRMRVLLHDLVQHDPFTQEDKRYIKQPRFCACCENLYVRDGFIPRPNIMQVYKYQADAFHHFYNLSKQREQQQ